MNNPKKFNAKKALKQFDNDPTIQDKIRNNIFDIDVFAYWLAEHIPAHEAHWTGVEQVQRINKFLTEDNEETRG